MITLTATPEQGILSGPRMTRLPELKKAAHAIGLFLECAAEILSPVMKFQRLVLRLALTFSLGQNAQIDATEAMLYQMMGDEKNALCLPCRDKNDMTQEGFEGLGQIRQNTVESRGRKLMRNQLAMPLAQVSPPDPNAGWDKKKTWVWGSPA